jgi:transcriptional regulator with XRE-family HTH domain
VEHSHVVRKTEPFRHRSTALPVFGRCELKAVCNCRGQREGHTVTIIRNTEGMVTRVPKAGKRLRRIRKDMGLSLRDVVKQSSNIAEQQRNPDYALSLASLASIESHGQVPHVYRLASLADIYGRPFLNLLALYTGSPPAPRSTAARFRLWR